MIVAFSCWNVFIVEYFLTCAVKHGCYVHNVHYHLTSVNHPPSHHVILNNYYHSPTLISGIRAWL